MTSGEVDVVSDHRKTKSFEDWTCSNCNFSNFQSRDVCKQCSTPNIPVPTVEQPAKLQKRKLEVFQSEESAWVCDECSYQNYASASECFQCKTSQEAQLKRKKENPNNWTCASCGNNNWPHRTVCNRCKTPKTGLENQLNNGLADWTCFNCDNVNRAYRAECNKCRMPKGEAINPETAVTRTNIDWLCMSCGNSNYPYRIACNKCKLPKKVAMCASRTYAPFDNDKDENWLCFNCDNVNLPFRTECNKCKIDKKEGTNPNTAFHRTNLDWKCTVCENVNFYYRIYCNKCQLPKSEIGEEVQPQPPCGGDQYHQNYQQQSYQDQSYNNQQQSYNNQQQSYNNQQQPYNQQDPYNQQLFQGVPQEPIAQHAAQMYRQQQQQAGRSNYTVQHDLVNNRTENWTCFNCDNMNFPLRSACNKCKMEKAEAVAPETRAGRLAAGDTQWRCPLCNNQNYHFRIECNKCQADRPPRASGGMNNVGNVHGVSDNYGYGYDQNSSNCYSGGYPVQTYSDSQYPSSQPPPPGSGGHSGEPTSNWICTSCENVNWPKRSRCNKCGIAKSTQDPNWVCRYCSHINYSFVSDCSSCKACKDS